MLESITEMKKQIDSLVDLKKNVADLKDSMRSVPIHNNRVINVNNEGGLSSNCNANTWTGMKNDVSLKVNLSNQENKGGTTNKPSSTYADKGKR